MIRIPRPHWLFMAIALLALRTSAQSFSLPTENRSLISAGKPTEEFLVGTAGKSWESGQFGCVRSDGRQFHEGLDIRCTRRDRRGEPTDPVFAAADGTVAYVSLKSGLSNYGNYIVLRHIVDNIEIHTLYAHLASVESGIRPGQSVKSGQRIATMGRTSNTRQRITTDRAHLHFEIAFRASQDFSSWHRLHQPGNRNDHGEFNGHNFLGIEPAAVLLASSQSGPRFSLAQHLASQPSLLRVFVRNPAFPWARRFPGLVQPNAATAKEGVAGWEVEMAFNGAPLRLTPRTSREMPGSDSFRILSVNEAQRTANPCSRLVIRRGQAWTALPALQNLLSMASR